MDHVLVKETKYEGSYVALGSFSSSKVICSGQDFDEVINKAESMGFVEPVVVYVPDKNMSCVYLCQ